MVQHPELHVGLSRGTFGSNCGSLEGTSEGNRGTPGTTCFAIAWLCLVSPQMMRLCTELQDGSAHLSNSASAYWAAHTLHARPASCAHCEHLLLLLLLATSNTICDHTACHVLQQLSDAWVASFSLVTSFSSGALMPTMHGARWMASHSMDAS